MRLDVDIKWDISQTGLYCGIFFLYVRIFRVKYPMSSLASEIKLTNAIPPIPTSYIV